MKEALGTHITQIQKLEKEALAEFLNYIKIYEHSAKTLIIKENSTAKYLYYIIKGAAKAYYYKNGKKIVYWLALEDNLITSFKSFITGKAGFENIELVEDSTLAAISFRNLNALTKKHPSVNQLYRKLLEESFLDLEEQYIQMHFYTAKEKYDNLLKKHPQVFKHFSLGDIAAYLGIAQESLSRIRGSV